MLSDGDLFEIYLRGGYDDCMSFPDFVDFYRERVNAKYKARR